MKKIMVKVLSVVAVGFSLLTIGTNSIKKIDTEAFKTNIPDYNDTYWRSPTGTAGDGAISKYVRLKGSDSSVYINNYSNGSSHYTASVSLKGKKYESSTTEYPVNRHLNWGVLNTESFAVGCPNRVLVRNYIREEGYDYAVLRLHKKGTVATSWGVWSPDGYGSYTVI